MAADSMIRAFLAGRELQLQQERRAGEEEDRKLHQETLRHQLAEMKLADKLRARQEAEERIKMLTGTPGQDIPPDLLQGPPETAGLPITDVGGAIEPQPPVMGFDMTTGRPQLIPGEIQTQIPFNQESLNRFKPITVPGIYGPDTAVRPQTREESLANALAAQRMEAFGKPQKLGPGEVFGFPGERPLMTGGQNPNEQLVQVAGPDGRPIWTRRSQAEGKPAYVRPRAEGGREKPLSPAQRAVAQREKKRGLDALFSDYKWDAQASEWASVKSGDTMSHDEMRDRLLDIENSYRTQLGVDTVDSLEAAGWKNWQEGPGSAQAHAAESTSAAATVPAPAATPARTARPVAPGFGAATVGREPAQKPPAAAGGATVTVTLPDGRTQTFKFPTQQKADEFKAKAGIR